jgi:hypothetical protein
MNPSVNRDRSWGRSLAAAPVSIILLAGVALGAGQIEPGSPLAARIAARKQVRVVTTSGATKVLYPQVLADGIRSSLQSSPAIPWNRIRTISYRRPATLTGVCVGAGVGLAFGAALLIAVTHDLGKPESWLAYPLVLVPSMGVGMLCGALVGSFFTQWKTLYERPAVPAVARVAVVPVPRGGALTMRVAF